jgi:hypothetical protein
LLAPGDGVLGAILLLNHGVFVVRLNFPVAKLLQWERACPISKIEHAALQYLRTGSEQEEQESPEA